MALVLLGGAGVRPVLAALGTYGVVAYSTSQRTHEIGVRMALGAGRRWMLVMVARQGLGLALLGLAIGARLVFLVTPMIHQMLSDSRW